MKKLLIFLVLGIFLFNLINAQIETNYYIFQDKVLVEYYFDEVSNLELKIPYDVDEPEINFDYDLEDFGSYKVIKVDSAKNLSIKYITKSMIDKSGKEYYFTSLNSLNFSQKVKLVLPESAVLVEQGIFFPNSDLITSNGRNIILEWNNYSERQIIISYEFVEATNFFLFIVFSFLILVFLFYILFQRKIFKKNLREIKKKEKSPKAIKKENLTLNLFEDEKRIIEYLLSKKKNESWTKEILKDLGITKVKLSRKLRSLEHKELIKKIPYGNSNKIRLVKR